MARHFAYYDDWHSETLECSRCGWKGTFHQGSVEYYGDLMDSSCPQCRDAPMLAIVTYPTIEESRANWEKLDEADRLQVEVLEPLRDQFDRQRLKTVDQLPEVSQPSFSLAWDIAGEGFHSRTLIKLGDRVLFSEPAVYEGYWRFEEVARILRAKYGSHLQDLVPTERSFDFLYGDRLGAPEAVRRTRLELFSKTG